MVKIYNIDIEDNGAGFLVVINKRSENRLVISCERTLLAAWEKIVWLYEIESQEFTVGRRNIPVKEWIEMMKKLDYID